MTFGPSIPGVRATHGRSWVVYHGTAETVLAALPSGLVDHVITDPPYESEAHTKMRRSCVGGANTDGTRNFRSAPISFAPMTPELRAAWMAHFARVSRRWVLVFCQVEGVPIWRADGERHGLRHMRSCVWVKPDATPQFTGDRPGSGYEAIETMLHAVTEQDFGWVEAMYHRERARWNGGGKRGVFVHCAKTQCRRTAEDHETPKPPALMLELVELFTDPGDVVLDAFSGSGTTGEACVRRGRAFVGVESDERWYRYTCERLAAEEADSTVRAQRGGQVALFGDR